MQGTELNSSTGDVLQLSNDLEPDPVFETPAGQIPSGGYYQQKQKDTGAQLHQLALATAGFLFFRFHVFVRLMLAPFETFATKPAIYLTTYGSE